MRGRAAERVYVPMKTMQLTEHLYYCGVADPGLRTFDIIMETKFGTSYNSYLLKTGETAVLFETAKACFAKEYLEAVESLTDLSKIEAVVVSHTEPDHVGSLKALLQANPRIRVIGTVGAVGFLKEILNRDFDAVTVKDGDSLTIGGQTLRFFVLPNLHWPDTMYTHIEQENALVTCDSFGAHYCCPEILRSRVASEADYMEAAKFYYDCILSPFSVPFMQKGIAVAKRLAPALICPGHGPVLDCKIPQLLEQYGAWAVPVKTPGVVLGYVSAYGYTKALAAAVAQGVESAGKTVRMYDLEQTAPEAVAADIAAADGFLLGSPTILGDALPPVWDVLSRLHAPVVKGKPAAAFGSYGWSGEAVPNLTARLTQLKCAVQEGYRIRFAPSEAQLEAARAFGRSFAEGLH